MGLESFPCEERLWDWGWFSQEKGWLQEHPATCPAPVEETQLGFSQWCMVGAQEAAAKAETREAQAGDKEKPFSHEDNQVVGPGPREIGPYPSLGVSCPD